MAKLNISQKKPGIGPFIDSETATELAKEWIMSNRNRRRNMKSEYDLLPLLSKVRGGEIKFGVVSDLQQKPNMIVPGLDNSGNLIFLRGYPNTKMLGPRDFYDTRKKKNQKESVNEERQFQLRASKSDGCEDVSEWYDDEDTVYEMKRKIDKLEKYESTKVLKRIKGMKEDEDEDNDEKPTLEAKIRGGPKGKGKPLGTQVHQDKKKERSKKAARGKVQKEGREDKDIGDMEGSQPSNYYKGVDKDKKDDRARHFEKGKKKDDDDPSAYTPAPGDKDAETKPSKHTKKYKQMYGESTQVLLEKIKGLEKKSEESGIKYSILKDVYDRGMAAWKTGHRPGTTPQQWAFARVNSFITGGKTQKTADKDLWAKVDKSKLKKK